MIPASGPAAHTRPTSWMSRPYRVVRIHDSAEICTERAKPIAVAGRARTEKNALFLLFWKARIVA